MTNNHLQHNNNTNIYEKLIAFLHRIYSDIISNIVLFIICIIACILLLYAYKGRNGGLYKASFTVIYEESARKVYGDRLEKLDMLINTNPKKAQSLLGLDNMSMSTLKQVEGTNILGESLSKDLNTDRIPFIINVGISDTHYINKIQNAILLYLETRNSYLIDKRTIKINELKDELAFLDRQLSMMDSLKRKHYYGVDGVEKPVMAENNLYQISYDLFKKRQELTKKLDMPMNLYVIDDALAPSKGGVPHFTIIVSGIIAGIIVYLFIVYIVLAVLRYKPS